MKTRLTYIGGVESIKNLRWANFQCDCGKVVFARMSHVSRGLKKSCGCLARELVADRNRTHGLRHTREYSIWSKIKQRVFDPSNKDYHNYGGRGIQLYQKWVNDPEDFIKYIQSLDNASDSTLSLDRIENNGHYEPGNLKWSTIQEQANNRRPNLKRIRY